MVNITKTLQEWIYQLSTRDKYSDFDSSKLFNRVNKPGEAQVLLHYENVHEINSESPLNDHGTHEVKLAWRHIKNWLDKYSPDLNSSLQHHCTANDLRDFQKDLGIRLPPCVEQFYLLTDGQLSEDFNSVGGIIFGLKLMSLDEVLLMTQHWRKVAKKLTIELSHTNNLAQVPKINHHRNWEQQQINFSHNNDSSTTVNLDVQSSATRYPKQRSIPPGAIHSSFAHPCWIPLITDDMGNCIGLDLSPPPNGSGKYGQVILFGREFDTKFLIADNWGDFLLIFANDLETGNWDIQTLQKNNYGDLIVGKEGDLVFMDKDTKMEINYLTVLKQRSLEKWIKSLDSQISQQDQDLINVLKNSDTFLDIKNINHKRYDEFMNVFLYVDTLNDQSDGEDY